MTTGHIGMRRSDEARSRMSAAHLGKKHKPETIEKLRAAAREQHHGVARHPCHGLTRDQRDTFDEIVTGNLAKKVYGPTERALVERGLITVATDSVPRYSVTTEARQQWLRWRGRVRR